MKNFHFILTYLLLCVLTSFTAAQESERGLAVVPKEQRHAILIGINDYPDPVSKLKFCVKDMTDLAAQLEKVGFPKENIRLMVDSSEGDSKPTGENICERIEEITKKLTENDFLFVAFSGHGVLIEGNSYLCPIDLDSGKLDSFVDREALFKLLDECVANRKIFLCDACRNEFQIKGAGGRALLNARTLDDPMSTNLHGFILMSSCAEKQQSIEYGKLGNGVFTHFLLEGLRGAAANEKGFVSVMRLFAHANDKTINFTRGQQTPMFRPGGETSDFIIGKIDRPEMKPQLPTIRIEDISGKITWGEIEIPPAEEIIVEDLVLPPVPAEITRTRIEIQLIQEAIRQLNDGTHPVLQQAKDALAQAKATLKQAEANYLAIDAPRKASWAQLPESTQTKLLNRLTQDPDLKIADVRDLCPNGLSYLDFTNMVEEGRRVIPVRKEYFRLKSEYEQLTVTASSSTVKKQALEDLAQQSKEREQFLQQKIQEFKTSVLLKIMEDCPGFDDGIAEFPFDALIPRIPALERYEFGWKEKALFNDAEKVWNFRPCAIKNLKKNLKDNFNYEITDDSVTITKYIGKSPTVTIPYGVTTIGNGTFGGCSSLTAVTIPDSVTTIGKYAFAGCSSLESVTIPDSVTNIGMGAFAGCSSLESVTIPDSVTTIGAWAFDSCESLTAVTIPDSVTNIGNCVFYGCDSLKAVTIPDSVTYIGEKAFGYTGSILFSNKIKNFTIHGKAGSAAERYAEENEFEFQAVE